MILCFYSLPDYSSVCRETVMPSRDPQGYVALLPLPIPSQRGVKIQARSATVFNPTIPSRDEVRRSNYRRRLQQLTSQGFRSVSHKPYQGIGDPFYLEEQRLILHSLGQWDGVNIPTFNAQYLT